jgi:AcrR family transcriptional regulator
MATTGKRPAPAGGPPRRAGLTRERLIDAAEELFYRDGVRATGVEAVAQAAHVAKISLYRTFETKDELVGAYLDRRSAAYWQQWAKLAGMHDEPRDKILAVIDFLADRTTTPGYRGCPFMNCAIEFPDPRSPQHKSAVAMKQEVRRRLRELCAPLTTEPARLADELVLLIEGAYAAAHTLGGKDGPARFLPRAARALLAAPG